MLNFDEFKAANERERAHKQLRGENDTVVKKSESQAQQNRLSVSDILEMPQLQSFVLMVLLSDTFLSFCEVYLRGLAHPGFVSYSPSILLDQKASMLLLLKSINGFSISFFAAELLVTMLVFRLSIIGHIGYMIDIVVVTLQLYLELNGIGRESRVLNIFRIWRLVRLFNTHVSLEVDLHQITKNQLAVAVKEQIELNSTISKLQQDITKEKEAKAAVESMLQGYKEEVDTLNEALKIAAMDIADVAQADDDYLESEDEGMLEESLALNNDDNDDEKRDNSVIETFFVQEDGTFKTK